MCAGMESKMNELTKVQSTLIEILRSFMRDEPYRMAEDFEGAKELFQLAAGHQMAAAVYEQIRGDKVWSKPEWQALAATWKRETLKDVMTQMQRADGFLAVYEKLCGAGVKPMVIKGLVCRNLYSKPDYRVSGDEDILVGREDFKVCDQILVAEGFRRSEEYSTMPVEELPYEIDYINHQTGCYIELHFALFEEGMDAYGHLNREFEQVPEHRIREEIRGQQIWTFDYTEHLFFLICHSFKHFLHCGFGLRQVSDMVLMAEKYGAQIDWSYIRERLERLNMKTYWDGLVRIGEVCFGLDRAKACYPDAMYRADVEYMPLLLDLLDSGVYGQSSTERKYSGNMTLSAAAGGRTNTVKSLKASLFPKADYMKKQFPWAQKYPALLPAAYVARVLRFVKQNGVKTKGAEQNVVQFGMGRVELLKQYDIIK